MSTPAKCQVDDLIEKLPKLGIAEIPNSPSPTTSAPVEPAHSLMQGQEGNLMQDFPDITEFPVSRSLVRTAQYQWIPLRPPSSVVHSPSAPSSASNGQTTSLDNSTSQGLVGDLIEKLPKLCISEIPNSPSPSTSAPIEPAHSLMQGQEGNLRQKFTDITEFPVSSSLVSTAQCQRIPLRPPSSVVHSPYALSSASNGQTTTLDNSTSQANGDQPLIRCIVYPNVHCRAPAPHLRRNYSSK